MIKLALAQEIVSRITPPQPTQRFSSARWPYTYAYDLVRQHPEIVPSSVARHDGLLSRADAAGVCRRWALAAQIDAQVLVHTLAYVYCVTNGIEMIDLRTSDED